MSYGLGIGCEGAPALSLVRANVTGVPTVDETGKRGGFTLALRWTGARLTAKGDHRLVRKLWISALSTVVIAAAAQAGTTQAAGIGSLPPGWSHVQVNVVIKHQPHTIAYDRGRVQSVSATSLTLRERDGSPWTITVGPATKITIDGRPATLAQVRPLEQATTMAVDGGAATFVRVQIPPALAAAFARQAARQARRANR
jgi:hypothetical protein